MKPHTGESLGIFSVRDTRGQRGKQKTIAKATARTPVNCLPSPLVSVFAVSLSIFQMKKISLTPLLSHLPPLIISRRRGGKICESKAL